MSATGSFYKLTKLIVFLSLFLAVLAFSAKVMSPVSAQGNVDLGTLEEPPGVDVYNQAAGTGPGSDQTPLLFIISRGINLAAVIAGIWSIFNVIFAGHAYITGSGNADSHKKAMNLIVRSALGMLLIVVAYSVGGLIGLIFFGDAGYILNPSL